jgi:hypothetical protein
MEKYSVIRIIFFFLAGGCWAAGLIFWSSDEIRIWEIMTRHRLLTPGPKQAWTPYWPTCGICQWSGHEVVPSVPVPLLESRIWGGALGCLTVFSGYLLLLTEQACLREEVVGEQGLPGVLLGLPRGSGSVLTVLLKGTSWPAASIPDHSILFPHFCLLWLPAWSGCLVFNWCGKNQVDVCHISEKMEKQEPVNIVILKNKLLNYFIRVSLTFPLSALMNDFYKGTIKMYILF